MIRFVVRRLCLRKADDPSVVNGCAKKSGSIRNNGLSEYLRNVDGQKLCLWEAGDYPVTNDGCIKKTVRPGKTASPNASVQLAALYTIPFLPCGKVVDDRKGFFNKRSTGVISSH